VTFEGAGSAWWIAGRELEMRYAIVKETYAWPETDYAAPMETSGPIEIHQQYELALKSAERLVAEFDEHDFISDSSPPYHWAHNTGDQRSYHFLIRG
jgi:hypothetical protein